MELFRLFGRILVDNEDANRSIADTNDRAEGLRGKFGNLLSTVGKWGAGVAAAAGTAAIALGTTAYNAAEDLKKALNGLQASTGTSTEGMAGMRDAMLDIYNNNFGQSFEDIGIAMQTIAQQTKLVGDELSTTTQNALAIRDTFGIDVNESIRSVNQLMKNFGLSADEAYNLLAQGAQSGLNANDNLADSINEYSVHFAQIGLDADDMFNMMANGAKSGVFDIDKLGDAIKEFGIRVKDESKGTNEAFTSLGLDAGTIGGAFAKGGEEAQKAFETVTKKLNEVKDPLAQNTIGVQLFGTMWEDIGAKGIAALTTTEGGINKNVDALGKINEVKYNTFGEAITGIGRQLETGILIPLGEKILPLLQQMADWFSANMPAIVSTINSVIDGIVKFADNTVKLLDALTPLFAGIAAGAITFGIYQLAINAATIATTVWTAVTTAATAVGTAFGAVLAFITSPIGLVVIAIGLLVAAGVLLYKNWDTVKEFLGKSWEWIKETSINVFNAVLNFFKGWGALILAVITGPIGLIVYAVVKNWDFIKETLSNTWNWIKDTSINVFNSVLDFIKAWGPLVLAALTGPIGLIVYAVVKNWDAIKTKTEETFNGIKIWIDEKITAIKDAFTNAVNDFKEAGKKVFNAIWDGLKEIWTTLSTWVSGVVSGIIKYFTEQLETYKETGKSVLNNIWDGLKEIWETLSLWVVGIVTKIEEYFTNAVSFYKEAGEKVFTAVWDGLKEIWIKLSTWVSQKINEIEGIFTSGDILGRFKSAGREIFKSVWDGLKGIWGDISNWVNEKVNWLVNQLAFWRSSQSAMSGGGATPKARANGGNVIKNETYLVGEKGPELYVPNQSGTIIPNNKLKSGGTNIVINITGNTMMNEKDADKFGTLIVNRLKALGVT